jgi:hypothetical protein
MCFLMIWVRSLNNSVELALANLDLNELVLESITFDDGDPLEGSFSTSTNARIALDMGEEGPDVSIFCLFLAFLACKATND